MLHTVPVMFLVYELGAFAFLYGWPVLVIATCILLMVTGQPRWVPATDIALTLAAAVAYVAIWFLFGESNFRGSYLALAVCAVAGMGVVGIGATRMLAARKVSSRTPTVTA